MIQKRFLYSDKIYNYSSISNNLSFDWTTISLVETLSYFSLLDINLICFCHRPRRLWFLTKKTFETKHKLLKTFIFRFNWKYIALAVKALENALKKMSEFPWINKLY